MSIYRSTIYQDHDSELFLSIRWVLKTSCNLYIKFTSLLEVTINLHTGIVVWDMIS